MQVSSGLIEILKKREQLRLASYLDQANVWTIGYGATYYESGTRVKQGETITKARAEQLLAYHVGVAASAVNSLVTSRLDQGQFDALVSFVYNVGKTSFSTSTLLKYVNNDPNDLANIEYQFLRWDKVTINGALVVSNGLVNRRKEEIEIYKYGAGGTEKKKLVGLFVLVVIAIFLYNAKIRNT